MTSPGSEGPFPPVRTPQYRKIYLGKNSRRVSAADLRGLRTFHADYPESRLLLVYRGQERLRLGEVTCIPCDEFLAALRPGADLPH